MALPPKRIGRPPLDDPTYIISVRVPRSVFLAFKERTERLGFPTASEPVRRWIRRQAGLGETPPSSS
jgi:hypothetical protein